MKRTYGALLALMVAPSVLAAETDDAAAQKAWSDFWQPTANVSIDTRVDFAYDKPDHLDSQSGFHGRYVNLKISGEINSKLTYSLRQRLNKFKDIDNDAFSATDWLYVNFSPTDRWTFSAGKQIVAIGGYEYDRAPIDIYYASRFWNNIACYQFGVSATWFSQSRQHSLLAQICNSPYQKIGSSCYAYNLMWNGHMGVFSTIWSVNLLEYEKGNYANYITLGNRLDFSKAYIELDLMNRYAPHQRFWFDDYSVIAKAACDFGRYVTVFAKGGHERFKPQPGLPAAVDKPFYGAGVECYPIGGSRNLRLHAIFDITHDNAGARTFQAGAGIKWNIDIYKTKK